MRPGDGSTHWSTRTLAARHGVGKDTVARLWRARGLRPWMSGTFKLSNDPRFEDKLTDVVGLYLDPPESAVVLCVDEKSQCQALERTQPSLPLKAGRAATRTHDYKRHGTTTLYAALDAATGQVLTQCRRRHRHQEFPGFLRLIERHVPAHLDIHIVIDNYSAHKHEKVTEWLQDPRRADRWHVHFTPTSASWLNLVERWFKELTDKRLRRGNFTSLDELVAAIETWTAHWNQNPKPFIWHKTAQEIIAKVRRGRATLTSPNKSAHTTSRDVVPMFQDPRANPNMAQLIFNAHDVTLLRDSADRALGRDQIWITEKTGDGVTTLTPLSDYRPRRDEAIERRYMQGRYGGVTTINPAEYARATEQPGT